MRFNFRITKWDEENFMLFLHPDGDHEDFRDRIVRRFGPCPNQKHLRVAHDAVMTCVILQIKHKGKYTKAAKWWSDKVSQSVINDPNKGTDQIFALEL